MEIDNTLPRTFTTDPKRLQQILKNLLSNAFKFTSQGQVQMRVQQVTSGWSSDHPILRYVPTAIAIEVSDTGIGIATEKQRLIFEAFQQADGTTSRKYGGTGLGLTISREIARLLGGIIEVESQPGVGSCFTLIIPQKYTGTESIMREELEFAAPVEVLPQEADFTGSKILVIDDDTRNVFALTSILKMRGIKVVYAENGRQGINVLNENTDIDMVLMDTMMPEMDGLEATREIRLNPLFANLPIISLTAKAMKGDREKCLAAGASDYVTKPVDEQHLLSVIYKWLKKEKQLLA